MKLYSQDGHQLALEAYKVCFTLLAEVIVRSPILTCP